MSKDKHGGFFGDHHEVRKDLHEDAGGHPHHKQRDHVRHHHRAHAAHHHGGETHEERKFVDHENYLHRIETNNELSQDNAARQMMKRAEKASGTPGEARIGGPADTALSSIAGGGGGSARSTASGSGSSASNVKSSSSQTVNQRISSIRLRIAGSRRNARKRGAGLFK